MIAAGTNLFRCFPCCPWFCLLCFLLLQNSGLSNKEVAKMYVDETKNRDKKSQKPTDGCRKGGKDSQKASDLMSWN